MLNKKIYLFLTFIILLGLVACNNTANNNNDQGQKTSSLTTTLSSDNYPHTKAQLVQDAKYQFIPINPEQDEGFQVEIPQINYGQVPTQQQRQAAEAPAQQQRPAQQQPVQTQTQGINQVAQQVIDLTNTQRRQNGLPDLMTDAQLSGVAQKKSEDMQQKHYFSHTSPTYGSPFDMMRDFGVTFQSAGENIAQGQPTPQDVVQAWMNSEGHRANILNNNFTHIGIGYEPNGNYWTQMFISK